MIFTGINYLAVIVAAVVAFGIGAVWYTLLFSRLWMEALGVTKEEMQQKGGSPLPFLIAIVSYLIMAWVVAVIMESIWRGSADFGDGILAGFILWLGFTLTTTATNYAFPGRKAALTLIDAGGWLVIAVVMGAIIALFG
jgi:hypothetical protein